jgi:ABC-type Zn uptake system ZnuABC Zn-binding protein ZnuA
MSVPRKTCLCALLAAVAGAALSLSGCGHQRPEAWPEGKSPRVLVSLPALACFVANVAGDDAAVRCLLQATGPHEYEPTSQDLLRVRDANLFFINGLELDEGLARRLKNTSGNANLVIAELGESIPPAQLIAVAAEEKHEKEEGEGQGHHHGEYDPHVWLGIPQAIEMVGKIRDELKKADANRAHAYDARAAAYIDKLKKLQAEGEEAFKPVKKEDRKLIAFHDSLRYFARSFGLTVAGSLEPRAGITPDSKQFRHLVDLCTKEKIHVIAVEPQYPGKAAQLLWEEVKNQGVDNAQIVEVDPMETATPEDFGPENEIRRDYYEQKMRANIANLAKAFKE